MSDRSKEAQEALDKANKAKEDPDNIHNFRRSQDPEPVSRRSLDLEERNRLKRWGREGAPVTSDGDKYSNLTDYTKWLRTLPEWKVEDERMVQLIRLGELAKRYSTVRGPKWDSMSERLTAVRLEQYRREESPLNKLKDWLQGLFMRNEY